MGGWDIIGVAVKAALYIGVFGSLGTVLVRQWFGHPLDPVRTIAIRFAVLGIIASLAAFALTAVPLTDDASGMVDPEILGLLWTTAVGDALWMRLVGLVGVIIGVLLRRYWIAALAGILALWSFAAIGHVTGLDVWALRLVLLGHLLGVSLWFGILIPLRRLSLSHATQTHHIAHQFGRAAIVFVPLLIAAGLGLSVQLVGGIGPLLTTDYGWQLLAKIGVVGCLLIAAGANKLWLVPALERSEARAFQRLSQVIIVELACFGIILLMTAILTTATDLPT